MRILDHLSNAILITFGYRQVWLIAIQRLLHQYNTAQYVTNKISRSNLLILYSIISTAENDGSRSASVKA